MILQQSVLPEVGNRICDLRIVTDGLSPIHAPGCSMVLIYMYLGHGGPP